MAEEWLRTDFASMHATGSSLRQAGEAARDSFGSTNSTLRGIDGAFGTDGAAAFAAVVARFERKSTSLQSAVSASVAHIETSAVEYARAEAEFVAALGPPRPSEVPETTSAPLLDI